MNSFEVGEELVVISDQLRNEEFHGFPVGSLVKVYRVLDDSFDCFCEDRSFTQTLRACHLSKQNYPAGILARVDYLKRKPREDYSNDQ